MPTPLSRLIPVTDGLGRMLWTDPSEPEPGSIVLIEGLDGTCFQRHHSDGRWHSTRGGRSRRWSELLTRRNVFIVYDAAPRDPGAPINLPSPSLRSDVDRLDHVHVGGRCVKHDGGPLCT